MIHILFLLTALTSVASYGMGSISPPPLPPNAEQRCESSGGVWEDTDPNDGILTMSCTCTDSTGYKSYGFDSCPASWQCGFGHHRQLYFCGMGIFFQPVYVNTYSEEFSCNQGLECVIPPDSDPFIASENCELVDFDFFWTIGTCVAPQNEE